MSGRLRDHWRGVLTCGGAVLVLSAAACPGSSDEKVSSRVPDRSAGSSSDVLALLPEGPEKRKFFQDCTACHQFDEERAFVEGEPRPEAAWREVVTRMLQFGGVGTETPLISPERDVEATASWLATHLRRPPPASGQVLDAPAGAEITPFRFPFVADLPHDLAVDGDGAVVITGMFTHQMVRFDPSNRSWTTIPIPVEDANPRAIEIDDEGSWWVLLGAPGKIARYRPGGDGPEAWDTWDIGLYGHSLRLDGAGRAWFNGHFTRHPTIIGYLDIDAGTVHRLEVPDVPSPAADHPMPYGLRVGDDGRVWGTELRGGRLFEHEPASGTTVVHPMPEPDGAPRRPAIDGDGHVWIPEYAANRLTRFDSDTREFRSFPFPMADVLPYVAEVDRRTGTVWIGTAAADVVFSFDPASEEFTAYPMPTEGALIRHLVVDEARGEIWAAYGAFPGIPPRIVRIRPGSRGGAGSAARMDP